jgi:hypothetical protein
MLHMFQKESLKVIIQKSKLNLDLLIVCHINLFYEKIALYLLVA